MGKTLMTMLAAINIIIYLCTFGANVIATKWLNIENMDAETVADVIALMGVSIALQLNANLYAGCLLGINKQVKANVLCICWSFCKSAGALLVIIILQPNLLYFYLWHILADFVASRFTPPENTVAKLGCPSQGWS